MILLALFYYLLLCWYGMVTEDFILCVHNTITILIAHIVVIYYYCCSDIAYFMTDSDYVCFIELISLHECTGLFSLYIAQFVFIIIICICTIFLKKLVNVFLNTVNIPIYFNKQHSYIQYIYKGYKDKRVNNNSRIFTISLSINIFIKKLFFNLNYLFLKIKPRSSFFFWKPTFKKFSYFYIFKNNKNNWRDKK